MSAPSEERKLSIVMVAACPFPAKYGSPAAIKELAEGLADDGHEVHIVAYPYGDDMPVRGATVHRTTGLGLAHEVSVGPAWHKPLLDLLMVGRTCQLVWKYRADLIHAHNYEGQLVGICAKIVTGRPLLYNAVSSMTDELPSYRFIRPAWLARVLATVLDRTVPRFADFVLTVTEDLLEFLVARGIARERIIFIPVGVWPEMFRGGDPEPLRETLGLRGRRVVLYTGTLDRYQRLDILLRAFAELGEEFADTVLLIVSAIAHAGSRAELGALAEELGIASRVRWVGRHTLEELPDYLALGDVAVVPRPHSSGQPVKILNYMASSRAIVAAEGGAKGIQDGQNGLVCRDEDPVDMARALGTVLRDRVLAGRLGAAALETVRQEYDWRLICRRIEALYHRILSPPAARGSALEAGDRASTPSA